MKRKFSFILFFFLLLLGLGVVSPLIVSSSQTHIINVEVNTIDQDGNFVSEPKAGEVTRAEANPIYGNTDQLVASAHEDYEFSFYLESGYVLSINKKHSYRITENHQFKAVFRQKDFAHVLVVDANNRYLGTLVVNDGASLTSEDLEIFKDGLKSKPGYVFKGWSVAEEFTASKTTVVKANYIAPDVKYNVDVDINGDINSYEINHGKTIKVSAPTANFSHWEVNGVIASYINEYTFSVYSDMSVVAVYSEAEPCDEILTLLSQTVIIDDPIFYFLIQSQPSNQVNKYDILEQGLIYLYANDKVSKEINFETKDVQRIRAIRSSSNNEFSVAINANNSKYLYARSYLVVRTNDNNINIVFSETKYFHQLEYNINYQLNGGVNHSDNKETLRYTSLEEGVKLLNPHREGYNFTGWYTDEEYVSHKVTHINLDNCNETFYAKWERIAFDVNFIDDDNIIESQRVFYGDMVIEPDEPLRDGYEFKGWLLDGHKYDFTTPVTNDITLSADWEIKLYKVEFKLEDGTLLKSETINHGDILLEPEEPQKIGYNFAGWLLDGVLYNFSSPVTKNITLFANW